MQHRLSISFWACGDLCLWNYDRIKPVSKNVSNIFVALLTGSSIVALAISLAAQESLANAINGVFLTVFKPFEIGDRVHLINGKITGTIEDITLRHTIIKNI